MRDDERYNNKDEIAAAYMKLKECQKNSSHQSLRDEDLVKINK